MTRYIIIALLLLGADVGTDMVVDWRFDRETSYSKDDVVQMNAPAARVTYKPHKMDSRNFDAQRELVKCS